VSERLSLAALVLEERLAEPAAVHAAIRRSREGVPLALALTDEGVAEVALAAALRRRLGLPLVEIAAEPVDPEALAEITAELAARHMVIPLEVTHAPRKTLRIAMANPLDEEAARDVAYATGARVDIAIATPSAIVEALAYLYRTSVTKVMREPGEPQMPDEPTSPQQPAMPAPATAPYHRVADEASIELRLAALLNVLIERGIVDETGYTEEVRRLMKEAAGR